MAFALVMPQLLSCDPRAIALAGGRVMLGKTVDGEGTNGKSCQVYTRSS